MTLFDLIAARSRRAVERVYGEPVVIHPIDRNFGPNGQRARSSTRSSFSAAGCFYDMVGLPPSDSGQPSVERMPKLLHRSPSLTVSIALNPLIPLRTGDFVERVAKGTWFEVTEIEPDGVGGATLTLAAAKGLPDA